MSNKCKTIISGLSAFLVGSIAGGAVGVVGGFVMAMLDTLCANPNKTETTDSE